eukprot:GHRR01031243.1.p1 GENE.GHRR01031243.1~~GHRR01031243.1.p1  ORF type:complete len:247 (+),score=58.84 GHRR01031243.1:121-861(+)
MSDVEVVDEPLPRRRQAARRAKPIQVVVEDSDSEAYQPSPLRSKKRKHNAQAEELDATEVAEASSKCRKKAAKQPGQKRTDAFGRTVRFAASPSQAVLQRIQRALPGSAHRMFLISTKELSPAGAGAGRSQEFAVLGATGNVYTVTTSRHPHCTCPDHAKGNLCKHILFVMLRVLKLATDNPLVWQKALLTNEVCIQTVSCSKQDCVVVSSRKWPPAATSLARSCVCSYNSSCLESVAHSRSTIMR